MSKPSPIIVAALLIIADIGAASAQVDASTAPSAQTSTSRSSIHAFKESVAHIGHSTKDAAIQVGHSVRNIALNGGHAFKSSVKQIGPIGQPTKPSGDQGHQTPVVDASRATTISASPGV